VDVGKLVEVLATARSILSRPENDFAWSSWSDAESALIELDELVRQLFTGEHVDWLRLARLFAPTGPIQEVSLSSGWGEEFITLAERFDAALDPGD